MTRPNAAIACTLVINSLLAFCGDRAQADTFVSDFATSFDGWQQQWQKDSPTGTDGVVTHSTERGYLDGASLKFDMGDGFGDDGTLWIEKQFAVSATLPTHVAVSFQQFSLEQSDFNQFEVKAAVSTETPEQQADFTTIGSTDTAAGWASFSYDTIIPPADDAVWVALGIRVAWEGHRDYWIDHLVVSTEVVPEPSAIGLGMVVACMLGLAIAHSRRSAQGELWRAFDALPV